MNALDAFLIIFIAFFTIRGIFRGLIKELIIIFSLVIGFYLAFAFFNSLAQWLQYQFEELPASAAHILAFTLIFVAVNIVLRIVGAILEKIVRFTFLQSFNRIGGGLFGFLKSIFFLSIGIFIIKLIPFAPFLVRKIGGDGSLLWPVVMFLANIIHKILLSLIPGAMIQEQVHRMLQDSNDKIWEILRSQ